jgi:hypothetical protein
MPLALVFTSAPRGLAPGRSGYVTVGRHEAMPARLVELLESIGTPHAAPGSSTFTFRCLDAGGRRWRVLSRFAAGGLDHTLRDNRLAHHLAFAEDEIAALPPPADVARRWKGWLDTWQGEPTFLPPQHLDLRPSPPLVPCAGWREACGSGAKAAWLVTETGPASRSLSGDLDGPGWLRLLAESAALIGPAAWEVGFTTDAAVTGSQGFVWRCQATGGDLDVAAARALPAPEGPEARRAALGVGAAPATRRNAAPERSPDGTATRSLPSLGILGAVAAGLAVLTLGAWLVVGKRSQPPPPIPPAQPAVALPGPAEAEAARQLLRDQRALAEITEQLQRDDVAQAARLWRELARVAPGFAQRNAEPTLSRIRARLAASAARSLGSELDQPTVAGDPTRAGAVASEVDAILALGVEIGMPEDAARASLVEIRERARLVASLDIRPTLVVRGRWVTASAGPALPSSADFDLGPEAGDEIRRFLAEGLVGGPGTTAKGGIRLVAFRHAAHRDPSQPRMAEASIEPGASSLYAGESLPGGGRPSMSVTVGNRANAVSLNLPTRPADDFLAVARGLELVNAAGRRLCVVLLPEAAGLEALRLPLSALSPDSVTQALGPAPWIEPALVTVRVAGARTGLYPAGHGFPDRVIPSLVSPPSQLDTTLLRLAAGTGPAMPRAEVAERQRRAREGDMLRAGAPWTLRAVNLGGESVLTLAEILE